MEYPVKPEHINTDPDSGPEGQHFWDAFQNTETEVSARWLVRFAQIRRAGWEPFSLEELQKTVEAMGHRGFFGFNRLINPEQIFENAAAAFGAIAGAGNPIAGILASITQPKISVGGGWIVKGDDDRYYFTHDFVLRCFGSSPGLPVFQQELVEETAEE